jgi:hypothetical protein
VPLRNRVTPLGELIATPERELVYGNRGCLHDETRTIRRQHGTKRWIACQLRFRDRHRPQLMAPGRFTELFFLDEVTAFAAGHRPCAECRRADYSRLSGLWQELHPGQVGADAIDQQLHSERLLGGAGRRRLHELAFAWLPDGSFVLHAGRPWLVLGRRLLSWSPGGYVDAVRRPQNSTATTITPLSLLALLGNDWCPLVPLVHPTATSGSA